MKTQRVATLLALFLIAAVLLPTRASALECNRAKTPTDITICHDAGLTALNERLTKVYLEALRIIGGDDRAQSPGYWALRSDQTAWLKERAQCAIDADCVRTATERRIGVLSFNPDKDAPAPSDRFVGSYAGIGGPLNLWIMGLTNGKVLVAVNSVPGRPGSVCDYSGVGRITRDGRLVAGKPTPKGGGGVILDLIDHGIEIADIPENRSASILNCGQHASIVMAYRRRASP